MDFLNSIPLHMVVSIFARQAPVKNTWVRFQPDASALKSPDFDGQRRSEQLSRLIISLFGAVGLAWGYIIQQFSQTVYIVGAGFILAALVTIPPWPMYRRKPLPWQKSRADGDAQESQQPKLKKKK